MSYISASIQKEMDNSTYSKSVIDQLVDSVKKQMNAVFSRSIDEIVQQFKAGSAVELRLRFWPTWPETEVVPARFSLIGFSAAYKSCWLNTSQ